MEGFTVTHHGVPIGHVELPERRQWAGGPLEPLPAIEPLRAVLSAVAGRELAWVLLKLGRNDAPDSTIVTPELSVAFSAAAEFEFALLDSGGLPVPTELVRVADIGGSQLQVRAYFRMANASTPAVLRAPLRGMGGFGTPGG